MRRTLATLRSAEFGFFGVVAGALADEGQGVVDDLLGDGLLAVAHHLVDDLLDEAVAMAPVELDGADRGGGAARH